MVDRVKDDGHYLAIFKDLVLSLTNNLEFGEKLQEQNKHTNITYRTLIFEAITNRGRLEGSYNKSYEEWKQQSQHIKKRPRFSSVNTFLNTHWTGITALKNDLKKIQSDIAMKEEEMQKLQEFLTKIEKQQADSGSTIAQSTSPGATRRGVGKNGVGSTASLRRAKKSKSQSDSSLLSNSSTESMSQCSTPSASFGDTVDGNNTSCASSLLEGSFTASVIECQNSNQAVEGSTPILTKKLEKEIDMLQKYIDTREAKRNDQNSEYHATPMRLFKLKGRDATTKIAAAKKLIAICQGKGVSAPTTEEHKALRNGDLKDIFKKLQKNQDFVALFDLSSKSATVAQDISPQPH